MGFSGRLRKKSKRGCKDDSERSMKPWEELGIGQATYYRRKKKGLLSDSI